MYKVVNFSNTNLEVKMEKKEFDVLNRIYQDAGVGMLAIDKILKKIENDTLKKLFSKQYEMYGKVAERCDLIAMNENKELKDNSVFKKFKQTAMLYFSLWTDKSPRHIVELMITGTVMGIVDTIKAEKDLKPKREEIKTLLADFLQMQDDFYEKLKKQLSKV